MSAKQVRAGRAFVELFATDNMLTRTLDRAAAKVKAFAGTVGGIGLKAGAAGGAILAPLGKALFDAVNKGGEIKRIATQYGQTTDAVSALAGAFGMAGSDMAEFSGTIDGLAGKVRAAADAGGLLDEQLVSLGTAREFEKLSLPQQFDKLADAFGRIPDAAHRAAKAQEWFGAAGAKLLPFLKDGAAGLARMKAEGRKSGGAMDAESIERSETASKALITVWEELKNTIVAVGSALLPTSDQTKDITERIREAFAAAREWVAENKNLIIAVAAGGAALAGLGVSLVVAKAIIAAIAIGIGAVGAAFALLLSPVGLAAAAIAGIVTWFLTCTDTGKALAKEVGEAFSGMGTIFKDTWGGIVDAVKAGDLQGAFAILSAGVKALWRELLLTLKKGWNSFVGGLTEVIRNNPMLLPVIGAAIGTAVGGPLGTVAGLAAGTGLNFVDFEKHLAIDLKEAEDEARAAKKELADVIAGRKQAREQKDAQGNPLFGFALTTAMWAKKYFGGADPAEEARTLGNRQRGIFSGPVQQQLGYGDQMAKRQYDVQVAIKNGVEKVANKVEDLGKNVAVFKR
ncbi:hypothetical protein [Gemmata sp.]|uniref:hypothetical protein n=1 Tax=Gemmata sp. TaxID=1914242 RepID=UPI003F71BDAE